MEYNYKNRNEVPEEYRWDLTKWFQNDDLWYKELEEAKKQTKSLNKYKGKIFEGTNLYELLNEFYKLNNRFENLYAYAMLKQDEDLGNDKYDKMFQEASALLSEFRENISFITPEIIHSDKFDVKSLIKNDSRLKEYEHFLEELAEEKKYVKDEATEEIISILTKDIRNYDTLFSTMLNSCLDYGTIKDEEGNDVKLNTGNYRKYISSKNRQVRKNAYENLNKERIKYAKVLGSNLISFMGRKCSIAKIRGYKSAKDMFFKNDNIPVEVQEVLQKSASNNIKYLHEYYQVFKKLLGVDKLETYDTSAPIVLNEKVYSVEDAKNFVYEATKVLGEDYSNLIQKGYKERWVDFMPYQGKQSGGYSLSIYGQTSNILMSYNGILDDIGTLAHEMGHAVNNYLRFSCTPIQYAYDDPIIAEVASLSNEVYLANYIINNDFSREEKISAITEMLRTINSNFFGAVMENELEDYAYEKLDNNESINSEDLCEEMKALIKKYYGNIIEENEYRKYMWIPRSHYFRPYYLYKYATSICGAVYFSRKILKGDKETLRNYHEFLKSGSDTYPYEHLLKYGIDLKEEATYDELFDYYNELLDKLKELTGVGED